MREATMRVRRWTTRMQYPDCPARPTNPKENTMARTQYVAKIKDHLLFGALSIALAASAVGVTTVASAAPAHAHAALSVAVHRSGDDGDNLSATLKSLGPTAAD